jgi:AraC-like DNA-binding protein
MPPKPPPSDAASIFRFSTDTFPERERVAALRELVGRTIFKLDIAPLSGEGLRSEAMACQLPGLNVLHVRTSAVHTDRSRNLIADDDLAFLLASTCECSVSRRGRDPVLGPGDAALLGGPEPGTVTFAAEARFTTLRVPTAAIAPLVPDLASAFARRIPAGSAPLKLLVGYLASVLDTEALMPPELQQLAVTHVYDLLALAVGATRDAVAIAAGRGVRAARLHAAKAFVMQRLDRHGLSVASVAAHLGVTPRYVQMLFETEDASLSEFILAHRLLLARRKLMDPRCIDSPISAIAFDAGFGDLSYFNRTFRRRFGCTPSEVRAQVRRDGASD